MRLKTGYKGDKPNTML